MLFWPGLGEAQQEQGPLPEGGNVRQTNGGQRFDERLRSALVWFQWLTGSLAVLDRKLIQSCRFVVKTFVRVEDMGMHEKTSTQNSALEKVNLQVGGQVVQRVSGFGENYHRQMSTSDLCGSVGPLLEQKKCI